MRHDSGRSLASRKRYKGAFVATGCKGWKEELRKTTLGARRQITSAVVTGEGTDGHWMACALVRSSRLAGPPACGRTAQAGRVGGGGVAGAAHMDGDSGRPPAATSGEQLLGGATRTRHGDIG
jgi:hypothetical protein